MSRDQPLRQPERGSFVPKRLDSDTEATRVFRPSRDSQEVIAAEAEVVTLPPNQELTDDSIEELGDEAIVGQASPAHEPRPGLEVDMELRRVVISSPPSLPEQPQTAAGPRPVRERRISEPTLVIRDRRQLQDLQRQLLAEQALLGRSRSLWMWGALAILALVLSGMLIALARRERSSLANIPDDTSAEPVATAQPPRVNAATAPSPASSAQQTVDLNELPVERRLPKVSAESHQR